MDAAGGGRKLTGIRQIVKLKQFIQKWQSVTLGPMPRRPGGISPAISRRLMMSSNVCCDSDEDTCQSPDNHPCDVPAGYLAVYVGPELRRFIIPTSYLRDPLFKVLLAKVEEEFGFDHSGGLTIPCEIETFKYLLTCMENHQKHHNAETSTSGETSLPVEDEQQIQSQKSSDFQESSSRLQCELVWF